MYPIKKRRWSKYLFSRSLIHFSFVSSPLDLSVLTDARFACLLDYGLWIMDHGSLIMPRDHKSDLPCCQETKSCILQGTYSYTILDQDASWPAHKRLIETIWKEISLTHSLPLSFLALPGYPPRASTEKKTSPNRIRASQKDQLIIW